MDLTGRAASNSNLCIYLVKKKVQNVNLCVKHAKLVELLKAQGVDLSGLNMDICRRM